MAPPVTRGQVGADVPDSNTLSGNEVPGTTTASEAPEVQDAQQIEEIEREDTPATSRASVQGTSPARGRVEEDLEGEYQRLLAAKKKAQQAREIQLMKDQENKDWPAPIYTLLMHPKDAVSSQAGGVPMTEREQGMRRERYLEITKPDIYKSHSSQELDTFMRACQIVFDVRPITYSMNPDRINFAKPLLSNNASGSGWA
jgi:hypothetical protein